MNVRLKIERIARTQCLVCLSNGRQYYAVNTQTKFKILPAFTVTPDSYSACPPWDIVLVLLVVVVFGLGWVGGGGGGGWWEGFLLFFCWFVF